MINGAQTMGQDPKEEIEDPQESTPTANGGNTTLKGFFDKSKVCLLFTLIGAAVGMYLARRR